MSQAEALSDRFRGLWERLAISVAAPPNASDVWEQLAECYAEPHRFYHALEHIADCLNCLDEATEQVPNRDALEMAIWFHDLVLLPGSQDNEQQSASMFVQLASGCFSSDFVDKVRGLILATNHREPPRDLDQAFICDIDLHSFGRPWESFKADTRKVQAEFQGSEEEFLAAQKRLLSDLLQREGVFRTPFFQQRHEQQARANIRRTLSDLGVTLPN